jgi:hypothetical protein
MATLEELLAEQERRRQVTPVATEPAQQITVAPEGAPPAVPQEDRLTALLAEQARRQAIQTQDTSFPGAGVIEPAVTAVTGAIAEPIAGLAGIARGLLPGEEGAAAETVAATREALTFQPRTEAGKEGLKALGEALAPIGETLQSAEKFLGDETFEATGSPALAAAATTIPTALIEAVGLASAKGAMGTAKRVKKIAQDKAIKRATVEAAPDIEQLKDASRAVYKEIDEAGVTLKEETFTNLNNDIKAITKAEGLDADITPKSASVLKRLESEVGMPKTLTEIDTLRKVAQNAASDLANPADARIGHIIVDKIDTFLDDMPSSALQKGGELAKDVGPKYRVARELWGRARRSELINEAFEKAKNQASGFENGIVVQFRSILNNKKKAKFFKPKELDAMKKVVRGTTTANIAKVIGRLGFSEGHATNILGAGTGAGFGFVAGGAPGAVAVPAIGQVSRKLAQRLTKGNAEFADIVVRAGSDAEEITKAYLKNTPKGKRSPSELSELLLRPDIALDKALDSSSNLLREAANEAKGMRILNSLTVPATLAAPGVIEQGGQ